MNKHGQSIIEYVLIAILVILGIVLMGPYVLRSVNAHFKLWDDGVRDSFKENITQAPVSDVPDLPTNCSCHEVASSSCGSSASSGCAAYQRIVNDICSIQGCDRQPLSSCINDPTCCSIPAKIDCGSSPLPIPAGATGITCPAGTSIGSTCYCPAGSTYTSSNCPAGTAQGVKCCSPPPATGSPCYYGQDIMGYQCGSNSSIFCRQDTQSCSNTEGCPRPTCLGMTLFPNSAYFCNSTGRTPPSLFPPTNLNQDSNITFVNAQADNKADCTATQGCSTYCDATIPNCTSCPSSAACQMYCNPPYVLDASGKECVLQFTVAVGSCSAKSNVPSPTPSTATTKVTGPVTYTSSCTSSTDSSYVTKIINNQSFTACPGPYTTLTSVSTSAALPSVSSPPIPLSSGEDGCQNPVGIVDEGEPGQQCDVSVTVDLANDPNKKLPGCS